MKHKFFQLILFSSMISINAFAQPVMKWQKTIGGNLEDVFSSMDLTKDGGLILGGSSVSRKTYEKTEGSRGGYDYWVVKLNSTLNSSHKIEWDKTIGGNSPDFLRAIQQTSDGGYILGGTSSSDKSGEKTQNSRGNYDYWVVKLNALGKIQWDKTIGGNDYDELYSIQQTSDGGYILGGTSFSNISGEKTENSRGFQDYWVVKLDKTGNIQWDKTIGRNNDDHLRSIRQTSDGGYILGGDSRNYDSACDCGDFDYWIIKLGSNGRIQWRKTIGGDGDDFLLAVRQTSEGGYILGRYSNSNKSGEKTENSRGYDDYWVVKLNALGEIQWDKTIGGDNFDDLIALEQTTDGGYILGGWSASNISGEKTENAWCYDYCSGDYWVVKLNSSGEIQWDKTIGGYGVDECWSIKEIETNKYIVGGFSDSWVSGDKTQPFRGRTDYWIVKLVYQPGSPVIAEAQNESNIVTPKINSSNFTIYPNPAKDAVHVQINGRAVVSLTDQSGKVLLATTINGSGIINVSGLKPGLYYLKNSATGAVQKVIVSR